MIRHGTMATLALKAGPNLIIAPLCFTLCIASAIAAIVTSIMCSKDIKSKSTKAPTVRDCSITAALWCACIIAFLCYANAAISGIKKMLS